MKAITISLLALSALSAAGGEQATFTGAIFDETCARLGHAAMRMGPTDAECAKMCVLHHGDAYVLADGKTVYYLSDQKKPEQFAGQNVTVRGTLDPKTKTIQVDSITAAK
jgi:hypothetical protein